MKLFLKAGVLLAAVFAVLPAHGQTVEEILSRMTARNEWQNRALVEFRSQRKFFAKSSRFKTDSTMYVETVFRQPDHVESTVTSHEGSGYIRSRVFDKILEAEAETRARKEKQEVDIVPANYNFAFVAAEQCDDRRCYRLKITPKKKSKYSLEGDIWVDAEDYSIVRIHGSPSKKPSFWTRNTEVDRRYRKIQGIWLPSRMDSSCDVFLAGESVLSIEYTYDFVRTLEVE